MAAESIARPAERVELFWLPLGAGDNTHLVKSSGRLYERVVALRERREPVPLFHSALRVYLAGDCWCIEMTPVWRADVPLPGVVGTGSVGAAVLGRWRLFRYEVRCWRNGCIPDLAWAVNSPVTLSGGADVAVQMLDAVAQFPFGVWGRDEFGLGEMWNSNSLVSWLLTRCGIDAAGLVPPRGGRAPGWNAGIVAARRIPTHFDGSPAREAHVS